MEGEVQGGLPSTPPTENQGQISNPEAKPAFAPQAFLSEVRHTILGDDPDPLQKENFEASVAGRALKVIEAYFNLKAESEKYPYIKNQYVMGSGYEHEGSLSSRIMPSLSLTIGSLFDIEIFKDGKIDLTPPMKRGDDVLVYNTPPAAGNVGFSLHLDPKDSSTPSQLDPEINARIITMLDITKRYYDECIESLPIGKDLHEKGLDRLLTTTTPFVPIYPEFPEEEIMQLRYGEKIPKRKFKWLRQVPLTREQKRAIQRAGNTTRRLGPDNVSFTPPFH